MIREIMEKRWDRVLVRSDVFVSLGLVMILLVMIIPMPPMLLDLFLALNITIALMILVITLYVEKSLEFSIFPTVLLVTTLLRLSLNVASTRLILLQGHTGEYAAGKVIQSFGQFVVGGNYVVGIVVFLILVVINFIVITKGAGRVAEVSARFTLDAMPGKQMAIDADLNAGLINEEQARSRREEITSEADFFGAMDGASKFVRGDAIAGIAITVINICAGFIIGVLQQNMPLAEAARNYTTLTIGDGLVSQVPALVISTGAGILVSRSGGLGDFGSQIKKQFGFNVRAIWVVGAILLGFALIPGLPFLPFLVLSLLLFALAYFIQKQQATAPVEVEAEPEQEGQEAEDNYEDLLSVDLLELEVGYGLIRFVDVAQDGELLTRIRSIRKQFAYSLGFIMPPIHIKDNLELKPNEYRLLLKGVPVASAEMMPGYFMAMDSGNVTEKLKGVSTVEPAFGLPAIWISEDKKERAQMAGYTVVDCNTVMATHISEVVKKHAHELLGRQEAQNLLDNIAKKYPKLTEELLPNLMSLGGVLKVLQNLLKENVSIRDLRTILETLADYAPHIQDPDLLTEYVRQALARQISTSIAGDGDTIPIITLDQEVEEAIQNSIQSGGQGSVITLEPGKARSILEAIGKHIEKFTGGTGPVLLCPPAIRLHVKKLTERYFPGLTVISHNEIAPQVKIQSLGTVSLNAG
ncbi:MAG: flagellar biosynthesis protein FlhA [Desulfobacteraceae bacterium]|nr:flagellar biosynthesis protein FlhA [Desulfobacteraceae bacterium]